MKSYTDLEQSKKLAEFLPLESADMRFCFSHTLSGRIIGHYPMIGREPSLGTIPCWSLAALIAIIPNIDLTVWKDGTWVCSSWGKEFKADEKADNPIDACYKMIIGLKEEGLL